MRGYLDALRLVPQLVIEGLAALLGWSPEPDER